MLYFSCGEKKNKREKQGENLRALHADAAQKHPGVQHCLDRKKKCSLVRVTVTFSELFIPKILTLLTGQISTYLSLVRVTATFGELFISEILALNGDILNGSF